MKLVFVDGRKFEVRDTPPPGAWRRQAPAPAPRRRDSVDDGGTVEYDGEHAERRADGDGGFTMGADGALAGTLTSEHGISPISAGSLTGNRFTFTTTMHD